MFPLLLLVSDIEVAGVMETDGLLVAATETLLVETLPLLAVEDCAIMDNGIVMNCGGPVLPPECDRGNMYVVLHMAVISLHILHYKIYATWEYARSIYSVYYIMHNAPV